MADWQFPDLLLRILPAVVLHQHPGGAARVVSVLEGARLPALWEMRLGPLACPAGRWDSVIRIEVFPNQLPIMANHALAELRKIPRTWSTYAGYQMAYGGSKVSGLVGVPPYKRESS